MDALITTAVAVDLTASAVNLSADAVVQADGIFDTVTNLSNSAMTALRAVATLAVAAFCLWRAAASRFAIGAVIMFALVGGVVLWLIWGGTGFFQNQVGDEIENASPAPVVVVTDAADRALV